MYSHDGIPTDWFADLHSGSLLHLTVNSEIWSIVPYSCVLNIYLVLAGRCFMFMNLGTYNVCFSLRWGKNCRSYKSILCLGFKSFYFNSLIPDTWLVKHCLFSADGNYEVSFYSNVVIESTGEVLWVPPAIYKSSCTIDVEYFPFDEQVCQMIFGSWTFNDKEVCLIYKASNNLLVLILWVNRICYSV